MVCFLSGSKIGFDKGIKQTQEYYLISMFPERLKIAKFEF